MERADRVKTRSPNSPSSTSRRLFLESPIKDSAAVVREARIWSAIKSVSTERPSTPKDSKRHLFGNDPGKQGSRPPSAFSIGAHNFDPNDPSSRPSTAKSPLPPKLSPLDHNPVINSEVLDNALINPKTGKISKPLIIDKADIDIKSRQRNALRRNFKQPSSPIKALHITPTAPPRHSHSAGSINTDSPTNEDKAGAINNKNTQDAKRSHSASTINVDLTALTSQPAEGSISSSSSATSIHSVRSKSGSSKSGSRSSEAREEEETASQALYWNKNVFPLLETLEQTNSSVNEIYGTLLKLYDALENGNCMNKMSSRRRTSLLSTLFKLLGKGSSKLSLACARIILAVKVRKVNFISISKVIFKISREEGNDLLFLDNNLIEIVIGLFASITSMDEQYEALIYLIGSVKIWSQSNDALAQKLLDCNTLEVLMTMCCNLTDVVDNTKSKKSLKFSSDIMVQVTATLRNLAEIEKERFLDKNFFMSLNEMLMLFNFDSKLVLNISRIFSKFTLYGEVINSFFAVEELESKYILNAIYHHLTSTDIVTRLCFVLSNVASKNESARLAIFYAQKHKGDSKNTWCMKILNKVFEHYMGQISSEENKRTFDVLGKVISVIANLSIAEDIGENITCNKSCILHMMEILRQANVNDNEELVANTLTTFNNLSYYKNPRSYIKKYRVEITKLLFNIIICESMVCVIEAVKVFGNLSQFQDVQELLKSNKGDQIIITLLDSNNPNVVYSACGVLINMSANPSYRSTLVSHGILGKSLDILKELAPLEWRIGGVVCQLLWNIIDDIALKSPEKEVAILAEVLDVLLQENAPQNILDTSGWKNNMLLYNLSSWENDFVPYGNRLFEKLSTHHSQLVPLVADENNL